MNTKQLGVTRQLLTLVISLVATGCFVAGEYRRQAERIDDHLRIRFDEFRGWTKIEPEKRRLREAVTIYLRENPEVDPRIKRHLEDLEIAVGMTKEQVRLLWGEPHDSIGSDGNDVIGHKTERWFYDRIPMALFERKPWFYELVFDRGRLSEIIQRVTNQPL
jgi:hypothetical protein